MQSVRTSILRNASLRLSCRSFILNFGRTVSTSNEKQTSSERVFLTDCFHQFKYNELMYISHQLKDSILNTRNKTDLKGDRVAILCSNNYSYFISLLAIWLANGVPVPLTKNYTPNYLNYLLKDCQAKLIINGLEIFKNIKDFDACETFFKSQDTPVLHINEAEFYKNTKHLQRDKFSSVNFFEQIDFSKNNHKDSLIIYTSGVNEPPKGNK